MTDDEIDKLIICIRKNKTVLYIPALADFGFYESTVKKIMHGYEVAYDGEPETGLCAKLSHRTAYVHLPDADILDFRILEFL